jgi:hypothetical protein
MIQIKRGCGHERNSGSEAKESTQKKGVTPQTQNDRYPGKTGKELLFLGGVKSARGKYHYFPHCIDKVS